MNIHLTLPFFTLFRHYTFVHISYYFSAPTVTKFTISTILLAHVSHRVIHHIEFQILTLHRPCKSENL